MNIWTPDKRNCRPGHSLASAIERRNRYRFNPLAKVGSLFVPKPLRFAGYPCCCEEESECECCETTIISDGTASWITHTVSSGEITRVENSGPCVTYYVDSVSGGGAESGSGTEIDPWTNLNTVFSDSCICAICTSCACVNLKVKVFVKGTIDYVIIGDEDCDYNRNLIIEPWGIASVDITVTDTVSITAVTDCYGCVFKNTHCDVTSTAGTAKGFLTCRNSTFDMCVSTCDGTANNVINRGYNTCTDGVFDTCTASITSNEITASSVSGRGFTDCTGSTLKDCTATLTSTGTFTGSCTGFFGMDDSTFDTCDANGDGTGNNASTIHGFHICDRCTFKDCETNGDATGIIAGSTATVYGFRDCDDSTFDTCDATHVVSAGNCERACGFYSNVSPTFSGSTSDVTICTVGCIVPNCTTWNTDCDL